MNEVSDRGFLEYQREVHLSAGQRRILLEFMTSHTDRPSFETYEKFQKRMKSVDPKVKPKRKEIPNTRLGFESSDVKLNDGFDARQDLPEGWGVFSRYDSGANFGIMSAGQLVLTNLWNYWDNVNSNTRRLLTPAGVVEENKNEQNSDDWK